jgi:hypothetical protein
MSVRAGSTLTWRFLGDTLHNVTLANGPRGFSSPNLSDGRTYSKRLAVAGTYRLFCGLHPVDMTATVKVTRRKPALRPFFFARSGVIRSDPLDARCDPWCDAHRDADGSQRAKPRGCKARRATVGFGRQARTSSVKSASHLLSAPLAGAL